MIELLHIDCMEYMRGVPDKVFDLAIVDPPYGIGAAKEKPHCGWKDYGIKYWDNFSPDTKYFNELFRISQNQIIWGANHFITKMSFDSSCWVIWDKGQREFSLADAELAWTSFGSAVRIKTIHRSLANQDKIHPTQKPIALYKWLLKNYAKPGDKILDTHGGSMSSAIACHQMGFDLVLCEIDKDYYDAGVKRYTEAIKQQTLFNYQ